MKTALPYDAPKFGWKRQRSQHGTEIFHYPSDLARQLMLYPTAIGRARTPPGDVNDHIIQDRYLLHYVVKGELWHEIRNKTYIARPGDACLMDLSEHVVHRAGDAQPAVSFWIAFNGKDAARYFAELRADQNPIFSGLDRPAVGAVLRNLLRLTADEDIAYEWRAAGMLLMLLAELYAVRAQARPMVSLGAEARPYSQAVRQGIDWIIRYYEEPYSLKELCVAVGCSRSHFTRLFHKETGVPPVVWLNRYRVEQSKRLLLATDKSIGEIARAVGLPDQNYFARAFRVCAGVTPRAFREAQKINRASRGKRPASGLRARSQERDKMPDGALD